MATSGSRAGTHVVALLKETVFNTREVGPPDFDTNKLKLATWGVTNNLSREAVENQATRSDLGEHKPGLGLSFPSSEFSFNAYLEGVGTAAGDGVTPDLTALSHALGACLGGTPTQSSGGLVKAASSPTAILVEDTTPGDHAQNTLVAFQVGGGLAYVRPVGKYDAGSMHLLMALPSAPTAATDIIYGGINIQDAETGIYIIQGESIGKATNENYEMYGMVGNISIPEAAAGEAQTASFKMQLASFAHGVVETQVSPVASRPIIVAGGEFLIGNHGSTVTKALDVARFSFEGGRSYTADPDFSSDDGLCGWFPNDQQARLTLTVKVQETPPAGGAASWRAAWESTDPDTDNDFHFIANIGQKRAGSIWSLYLPQMHLVSEPEPVEVDGLSCFKLTFAPTIGDSDHGGAATSTINNNVWMAQH